MIYTGGQLFFRFFDAPVTYGHCVSLAAVVRAAPEGRLSVMLSVAKTIEDKSDA